MYDCNLIETATVIATTRLEAVSGALSLAAQTFHWLALILMKMTWSDEARTIFGSNMFYPFVAATTLFLAAQLMPTRVVKICTGYCVKRLRVVARKMRSLWARLAASNAVLALKRLHVLVSAKVLVEAAAVLLF